MKLVGARAIRSECSLGYLECCTGRTQQVTRNAYRDKSAASHFHLGVNGGSPYQLVSAKNNLPNG